MLQSMGKLEKWLERNITCIEKQECGMLWAVLLKVARWQQQRVPTVPSICLLKTELEMRIEGTPNLDEPRQLGLPLEAYHLRI